MLRISIVCGNADGGGQEGGPRTGLEDQEEQMHTCPSDCLFPVQNETLSPQNPLTRASGVRLIPAGHRRNRQHWGLHREQGRSHHRDNGGILGLGKLELAERKTPWEGGALGQSMARGLERFPSTWLGTA